MQTSHSFVHCSQIVCTFILFTTIGSALADDPDKSATDKVDAAALIREIRQQEAWFDSVESLQLAAESKWTRSAKSIEIERKQLERQFPGSELDSKVFTELRPELVDTLDFAFDAKRLRFVENQHDFKLGVSTWDGEKLIHYNNHVHHRQEGYILMKDLMVGFFSNFAWPSAQFHSFWWCQPATDENREAALAQFGTPEEYEYLGRDTFHGRECHVLFRPQDTRYYVDVASGRPLGKKEGSAGTAAFNKRLIQIAQRISKQSFEKESEFKAWFESRPQEEQDKLHQAMQAAIAAEHPIDTPVFESWSRDYKEVAPNCFFPMTQGYINNHVDEARDAYESYRRDIKVTKVVVNAKLPASLFEVKMKEGVRVYDQTHDPPLSYTVKGDRTPEEWKQIVDDARKVADAEQNEKRNLDALIGKPAPAFSKDSTWLNSKPLNWDDLKGRFVILDFWATGCGPCWNDIPNLQGIHDGGAKSDVSIVAIHSTGVETKDVQSFVDERKMTYPIVLDTTAVNEEAVGQLFAAYQVLRMPYSILVDREGRVVAHGSLNSLIEKIGEMKSTTTSK